ncbi:hypothetical protein HDK64DRAFT_268801 [Phyllosticta capitalensis]
MTLLSFQYEEKSSSTTTTRVTQQQNMSSQNQSDNHPGSSRDRDPPQVLVPEDMKWLMYHGLLSNDASNCGPGFIRGDRQALRDNFVCSSYSNRRVFCEHSTPETIDIPRYLYSCATLEYLGLSAKAAAYCGARYALAVADGRPRCDGEDATPFIAFAKDYLRKRRARLEQPAQEDKRRVMRKIGCSKELIKAIMTFESASRRCIGSWIRWTCVGRL